ncbi:MAG: PilZ domain-containing protein [Deltaproteobacteria bacterium]|nr:PilZ domain-containing protein [Deltaproteobacteria bacterium]
MESAVERRSRGGRIPFDVMVELAYTSDDQIERLEADGLDLGVSGMRVRTPFLPDPGTRLAARFEDPVTQQMLRAEGEVVWARDDVGELGLHFTKLNGEAQTALQRLVAPLDTPPDDAPDVHAVEVAPAPAPAPEDVDVDVEETEATRPARLVVEGVDTPLRVSVQHLADDLVTLSSDLGFLRIGARAFVDAGRGLERSGVIASIDLEQNGDAEVPRLVVGVVFDPVSASKASSSKRNQSTDSRPGSLPTNGERVAVRGNSPSERPTKAAVESRPSSRHAELPPPPIQVTAEREATAAAPEPMATKGARRDATPSTRSAAVQPPMRARTPDANLGDPSADRDDGTVEFATAMRPKWMTDVQRISKSARSAAFDGLKKGATKARPALSWLGAKLLVWLAAAFASITAGAKRVYAKIAERAGRPKKRTTAPPPAARESIASARRRAESEPARKIDFKTIALGLTSAAAVVLAVYALWPRDQQPDRFDVHREMAAPPAAAAPAPAAAPAAMPDPAPAAMAAAAAPSEGGEEGDLAPPIEDGEGGEMADGSGEAAEPAPDGSGYVVPGGVGDPSRAAGPMPAPRYPTPRTLRPGSPYALDVRPEEAAGTEGEGTAGAEGADGETAPAAAPRPPAPSGPLARTFGEERVHGGRAYTMRFNRRIQGIRGRAVPNGFTVQVEGAIAVDRAGPIAVRDADVVRANVVNTGNTSELTINFHERVQHPRYRIVARGSNLEITVGRATADEIAALRRAEVRARREARAQAQAEGDAEGTGAAAPRATPMIERAPRAARAAAQAAGPRARAAASAPQRAAGGARAAATPARPGAARAQTAAPARGAAARAPGRGAAAPAAAARAVAARGAGPRAAAAPARPGAARPGARAPRAANPR